MRSSTLILSLAVCSYAAVLPRLAPAVPNSVFPTFNFVPLTDLLENVEADLLSVSLASDVDRNTTDVQSFETSMAATAVSPAEESCSANPEIRYEWRQYSHSDRVAFLAAINCLIGKPPSGNFPPATNRYEDFVRLHQQDMPNVHNNAKFLVWHRYFLWTFEQVLRAECAFDRAMPWWDETLDAGKFGHSDMFTNDAYFGPLVPGDGDMAMCIDSGAFGGITLNIGPGEDNYPHCLTRYLDESITAECSAEYLQQCNSETDFASFESCLQNGPHASGHDGIGSIMSDVWSSPSDPIFYMHHMFVDHAFRIWQNGDFARTQSINGVDAQDEPLSMDTVISMSGIRPDITVGEIMNTLSGTVIDGVPFCYKYNY